MTLEIEREAIARIVAEVLAADPSLMRFRLMTVVGVPSGGEVQLAVTPGAPVSTSAKYEPGLTFVDGDSVWVFTVAGQPRVFGKNP